MTERPVFSERGLAVRLAARRRATRAVMMLDATRTPVVDNTLQPGYQVQSPMESSIQAPQGDRHRVPSEC